jgi:ABC transporter
VITEVGPVEIEVPRDRDASFAPATVPKRVCRLRGSRRRRCLVMATVRYDKATRIFPGISRPAVDALDLDIGDGEFLVLVGPSGSGTSTALRMLAGLEDIDLGAVYIGDRDVNTLPSRERDIADPFPDRHPAGRSGHHHRLRHPRPGRGDDHGTSGSGTG